jgi:carbonyl reductase 1
MTQPDAPARARTVLVTGASRGLGRETCRQLAGRGYRVVLTSRDEGEGRRVVSELARAGGSIEHQVLDVGAPGSIAALAGRLRGAGIEIDVLINNAAIALDGFDAEVARETIAVNFTGAMNVTDALLPLIPRGGGVVMVSSGVGELSGLDPALRARFSDAELTREGLVALVNRFVFDVEQGRHDAAGWPSSAYQVSKVALNALVRILAPVLSRSGILLNAVCPGWVRTGMGGSHAPRSVAEGAASIVWAASLVDGPTGGFFRDGRPIAW